MESPFESYHAHIYFPLGETSEVEALVEKIRANFDFKIGTIHNRPVGPHPIGSCQVLVSQKDFASFIPWLSKHRGELDIFVHPCSGNDLLDHTDYVMWLGKSYKLNIEMFMED